jgi:hypothetical protein
MKLRLSVALIAVAMLFTGVYTRAVGNVTLTITPGQAPYFDAVNVTGVAQDAPPGYQHGSFKSNGVAKTDMYFQADTLFPDRPNGVKIGDIRAISYFTKKGTTHAVDLVDWAFLIYTYPYAGDVSGPTWYGDRFGSEPYYAMNMVDPANTWNQWDTDDVINVPRFYESTSPVGNFGAYNDPDLATFKAGTALSGQPIATRQVMLFSIQTGSATAAGFTGQVDGLRIELMDGTVGKVNMEPFLVPNDKDSCKKDGWMTLFRPVGSPFPNQGDCVSYVMTGK